jgi:hypothetical protein
LITTPATKITDNGKTRTVPIAQLLAAEEIGVAQMVTASVDLDLADSNA